MGPLANEKGPPSSTGGPSLCAGTIGGMAELRRPWWKRKRWRAAAVALLVSHYFVSEGPARYGVHRGWVSRSAVGSIYLPAGLIDRVPYADDLRRSYLLWWDRTADAHVPETMTATLWGRAVSVLSEDDPYVQILPQGSERAVLVQGRYVTVKRHAAEGEGYDAVWVDTRNVMRLPPGTRSIEIDGRGPRLMIRAGGKTAAGP